MGGWDPQFDPHGYEDTDFFIRYSIKGLCPGVSETSWYNSSRSQHDVEGKSEFHFSQHAPRSAAQKICAEMETLSRVVCVVAVSEGGHPEQ